MHGTAMVTILREHPLKHDFLLPKAGSDILDHGEQTETMGKVPSMRSSTIQQGTRVHAERDTAQPSELPMSKGNS